MTNSVIFPGILPFFQASSMQITRLNRSGRVLFFLQFLALDEILQCFRTKYTIHSGL